MAQVMGLWDRSMKSLVAHCPQAFVELILHQAGIKVTGRLATEFQGYDLDADGLLELVTEDGEKILLHIEFQSANDKIMPERLLEYSFRAKMEHNKPVLSCVIFLRKDGEVREPPLCWQLKNGKKICVFDYICIKLWELTREELLAFDQPALLPLTLLTKGGANRTMVEEMFQSLLDNGLRDLLPAGNVLASLALKRDDLEWLERSYKKVNDILKDSPAYHWMTDDAREEGLTKGREEGLTKGREEGLAEGLRRAVLSIIGGRFPSVTRLAQKQLALIQHIAPLEKLVAQVSMAQTVVEVKQYLLEAVDESIQLD